MVSSSIPTLTCLSDEEQPESYNLNLNPVPSKLLLVMHFMTALTKTLLKVLEQWTAFECGMLVRHCINYKFVELISYIFCFRDHSVAGS